MRIRLCLTQLMKEAGKRNDEMMQKKLIDGAN